MNAAAFSGTINDFASTSAQYLAAISTGLDSRTEAAISWMESAAANSSHGYDQTYRWGQYGDYDCSSAVITAYESAGVPVKSAGATYTGNMYSVFTKNGFTDVTSSVNLSTGAGLLRRDVLLNTVCHTAMYAGCGQLVEVSINELGTATGGQPGDQMRREFWKHSYYNYPWNYVLRYNGGIIDFPSASISNFSVSNTTQGTRPNITGTIVGNASITYLWVGVLNSNTGKWVLEHEAWGSYGTSYSLPTFAANLNLASLQPGSYQLSAACVVGGIEMDIGTKNFTISAKSSTPSASISNFTVSNTTEGTKPSITGTLTSSTSIAYVWAGVISNDTGKWVTEYEKWASYGTSYPLTSITSNLNLSSLPVGKYTLAGTCVTGGKELEIDSKSFIVNPKTIAVTGISLNKASHIMTVGDTVSLSASITPSNATDKSVTWSSSNTAVATVSGGTVTAKAAGSTTITAKSSNGKTATCSITVNPKTIAVTGISLNKSAYALTVGNSVTLSATITPSNATDKTVSWSSSDPAVATVSNGLVRAVGKGRADIMAFAGDKMAVCSITVGAAPTDLRISTDRQDYALGETVEVTLAASDATAFSLEIASGDGTTEQAYVTSSSFEYTPTMAGTYQITAAAINDFGNSNAVSVLFTVSEPGPEPDEEPIDPEESDVPTEHPQTVEVHFPRVNTFFLGQFDDIPAHQWYSDTVASAFELGLMKGTNAEGAQFSPFKYFSIAETVTLASCLHSIYHTGTESFVQAPGDKWYQVYLDYALENGIIGLSYYNCDVTQTANRRQFAEILAAAFPDEALGAINQVADGAIPDIPMSDRNADVIYRLYRAGVLTGTDLTGSFSPGSYITRAEVATIAARMAESDNRKTFTLIP